MQDLWERRKGSRFRTGSAYSRYQLQLQDRSVGEQDRSICSWSPPGPASRQGSSTDWMPQHGEIHREFQPTMDARKNSPTTRFQQSTKKQVRHQAMRMPVRDNQVPSQCFPAKAVAATIVRSLLVTATPVGSEGPSRPCSKLRINAAIACRSCTCPQFPHASQRGEPTQVPQSLHCSAACAGCHQAWSYRAGHHLKSRQSR